MIKRPMLAASVEDIEQLRYPLLASPKLDGIRCLVLDGQVLSRSFKPIPNAHIREALGSVISGIEGFDGELMLGKGATFQDVSSAVMSREGAPAFTFHVFDWIAEGVNDWPFNERLHALKERVKEVRRLGATYIKLVPQQRVNSSVDLIDFENEVLKQGYEGVMLRAPLSPYKAGRSTLKEGYLLKLKRMEHGEAVIVGFEEQEANTNEAKRDEIGRSKRSTHKVGKVGKGTLGALVVRAATYDPDPAGPPEPGHWIGFDEFRIGGGDGLTASLRQEIWNNQNKYLRKIIRYRWQAHGTKDAPRLPQFEGFRSELDL